MLITKEPIRLVIFDLGSTLIYEKGPWDGLFPQADEALWRRLRRYGVSLQSQEIYGEARTLFEVYYNLHRGDLNEPTTVGVLEELLRGKGFELSKAQLRDAMRAMYAVTQANWLPEEERAVHTPNVEAQRVQDWPDLERRR